MAQSNVLRNIKLLNWFNFFIGFRFYDPIAILYFSEVAGSYALGMMVFGVTNLSQAIFEVPTGIFSDFIGRKRTMILGAVSVLFAVFCYALGFSYWILLIGGVFEGLAFSFFSGNNEAMLHDTLKEKGKEDKYSHFHGKLSGLPQVAGAVSALLGGFIAFYSYSLSFWLSLFSLAICLGLSLFLIEPKVISEKSTNIYSHLWEAIKLFVKNPKIRLLSFASIWSYGLGESGWLFRSAFNATVWPVWALGIPQTIANLGAAFGFFFAGRAISRFGAKKILLFGDIYARIVNIIPLVFVSIFSPIIAILASPFFGLMETSKSTLFQKEFTDKQRATMGSLNSFAGSILFFVVSFCLGSVADLLDPAKGLLILQVFSIVNLFIYWRLLKR